MVDSIFGFNYASFAIGLLAILNPCSFALLPSYLSLFLNVDKDNAKTKTSIVLYRAQIVSLMVSAGILTVFGILGLAYTGITGVLGSLLFWFNIILGIILILLGLALLFIKSFNLPALKVTNQGTKSGLAGMYMYGITYAVAALSCSLGLVAAAVSAANQSTYSGFFSFSVGMATSLTILTLIMALGANTLVAKVRKIIPYMNKISAVFLVLAGIYLTYYGWWELQINQGESVGNFSIGFTNAIFGWFEQKINPLGLLPEPTSRSIILGTIFILINFAVFTAGWFANRKENLKEIEPEDQEPVLT